MNPDSYGFEKRFVQIYFAFAKCCYIDRLPLHIWFCGPADQAAVNDTDPATQQCVDLKTTFLLHLFSPTFGPLERAAWVGRPRFPPSVGTFEGLDICSQYCSKRLKEYFAL